MSDIIGQSFNRLAYDLSGFNQLKRQAANGSPESIKQVAEQFETLFVNMMMQSMRKAVPEGGLFSSSSSQLFTSMFDQQIAQQAAGKGFGLADMLTKQLTTKMTSSANMASQVSHQTSTQTTAGTHSKQNQYLAQSLFGDTSSSISPKALGQMLYQSIKPDNASTPELTGLSASDKTDNTIMDKVSQFVKDWLDPAIHAAKKSGIPYQVIIAQAALETGWGQKQIKTDDGGQSYNYFGIKAGSSWQGKTTELTTTEYINNEITKTKDKFRVYDSHHHALEDYTQLLTKNKRYESVANAQDAKTAARALQDANYATDPNYADKLIQLIDRIEVIAKDVAVPMTTGFKRIAFNNNINL